MNKFFSIQLQHGTFQVLCPVTDPQEVEAFKQGLHGFLVWRETVKNDNSATDWQNTLLQAVSVAFALEKSEDVSLRRQAYRRGYAAAVEAVHGITVLG